MIAHFAGLDENAQQKVLDEGKPMLEWMPARRVRASEKARRQRALAVHQKKVASCPAATSHSLVLCSFVLVFCAVSVESDTVTARASHDAVSV